ncbi:hypothetical protein [Salinarimonas rosea]|uniref:hypothetical protein n=1 Tax=Salinarimonas rosea TaxID=552063 RepID=UPI0004156EC6|nr:hypothetical protein [Salinarimonas rosea]
MSLRIPSALRRSLDFGYAALVVLAVAVLNRVSGGGVEALGDPPGRRLWYVSGVLALLAAVHLRRFRPWREALTLAGWLAGSYLVWRTFEWGTIFDLGRLPSEEPRSPFGDLFFVFGSDAANLWVRMAVALVPGVIAGAWLARRRILGRSLRALLLGWLALATALFLAYRSAWRLTEQVPILHAELIAGAAWGVVLLSLPALAPRRPGGARPPGS